MSMQDYWGTLETTGWLDGYSAAERDGLRARLEAQFREATPCGAFALADAQYDVDSALRPDFGTYFLGILQQASGGRFAPEHIAYARPPRGKTVASLSFRFAGQTWSRDFSWEMDEPFRAVRALANDAVAAGGLPFRFFEVPGPDAIGIAFVRPDSHAAAQRAGLLQLPW